MELNWVILLALFALTIVLLFVYGTWHLTFWSKVGVPGPTPLPFIGNAWDFMQEGFFNASLKWRRKYGDVYGIYMVREPIMLTTNAEILKEVFIKDFKNFTFRAPDIFLLPSPTELGLPMVGGDQWKRLRSVMTPSFSSGKLKLMGCFINRCCNNLVQAVDKSVQAGESLNVKELFGAYTLDVIAGTGFGLETNCQAGDADNLLDNAKKVFGDSALVSIPAVLAASFPFLAPVLKWCGFSVLPKEETDFILKTIRRLLEERMKNPAKNPDLMQLLLDAANDSSEVDKNLSQKYITTDEMVAQGITFFIAGYDTTSTSLQFLSYLLALHPDSQEKLYNEVVAAVGQTGEVNYDVVANLRYLDNCFRETLRLFPPLTLICRKALEKRTIQGVTIPAGSSVGTSIYALLRDERYFPKPDTFNPERYEDQDNPIPSLVRDFAFGAGPRQCIGMRLAHYEAKMAAVSVIRKFRFVRVKDTPEKITLRASSGCSPVECIMIGCQRRPQAK